MPLPQQCRRHDKQQTVRFSVFLILISLLADIFGGIIMKLVFMLLRYALVVFGGFMAYREYNTITEFVPQSVYGLVSLALLLICALLGTPVLSKSKYLDAADHFKFLIATVVADVVIIAASFFV